MTTPAPRNTIATLRVGDRLFDCRGTPAAVVTHLDSEWIAFTFDGNRDPVKLRLQWYSGTADKIPVPTQHRPRLPDGGTAVYLNADPLPKSAMSRAFSSGQSASPIFRR
jgi:hypothetical protein